MVTGRSNSTELRAAPDLRVLDGVASWCGGLHGAMSLGDALKALSRGLGADAAGISRMHLRGDRRPKLVALYPGAGGHLLARGFCEDVLGYQLGHERPGSIWFLSEMQDDPAWEASGVLNEHLGSCTCHEIAVIPLAAAPQTVDYIEFHFSRPLAYSERLELEVIVPTIERSWAGRKPGLVTNSAIDERVLVVRRPQTDRRPARSESILGMSNPANLSRAEFRVCLLLSRGLSVKGVADELSLSENTVRSHLRMIYSKTETSSMPELIYLILSSAPEEEGAIYGRTRA